MPDYRPRNFRSKSLGALVSEVVIAYCNDTWWLVKGEVHIDDVLAAKEEPDLPIALVVCEKMGDVMQLWEAPEFGKMPWAINPSIIERLKTRERTTFG
jgi:hypothetical protein